MPPPHWVSLQHNRACEHIPCVDGDGLVHHKQHLLPVGGAARHGGGITGALPGPDSGLLQGRHSPARTRLLDAAQIPGAGRAAHPVAPGTPGCSGHMARPRIPVWCLFPSPSKGQPGLHILAQPVSTPSPSSFSEPLMPVVLVSAVKKKYTLRKLSKTRYFCES